jgi:flagellar motor switch protein FliN/FliY
MCADIVEHIELDELTAGETGKSPLVRRDMSLVSHVSVELTAEIGTAQLTIEALFALKAGDVVTLLQSINEPVTLCVDNKPVAQGNLVAVNDNFGIQVTHIL